MWEYFEGFYILSTKDSTRQEGIKENLEQVGIKNYEIVEFSTTGKIINNGNNPSFFDIITHNHCDETCQNITNNHFSLIEKAYNNGLENVVIFEDDARFDLPIDESKINAVVNWLKNNRWDIFYLGHCPWPIVFSIPRNTDIVKVFSPYTAHCYVLSRDGMINILRERRIKKPIAHMDKILASSDLEKFAVFPSISFQCIDPALYRSVGLPFSFRTTTRILEYIAFILPILILMLILGFIVHFMYKKWREK